MHDGLEVIGSAIVGDHRAVHAVGEVSLGLGHACGIAFGRCVGIRLGPGGLEVIVSSSNLDVIDKHLKNDRLNI